MLSDWAAGGEAENRVLLPAQECLVVSAENAGF